MNFENIIFGMVFLSFLLNLIVFIILVWPNLFERKVKLDWPRRPAVPPYRGPMMPNPWPKPKAAVPLNRRVRSEYGGERLPWPAAPPFTGKPPSYHGPLPGPRGPMMPNPWPDPKSAVPNQPTKKDQSSE